MESPQGPQKWYVKFCNALICASSDPSAPKKTWRKKCIDCLKPTEDELPHQEDQQPARETWGNRCTFFITTLGMSVGLGQVWRFPTLAYGEGGGAFLILYGIMIFFFGNALFFFEITNGQYSSKNPLTVYDKVPLLQGIGWSMIAYAYFFCTYYSHMVSFSIYYLYRSFAYHLPWTYCPSEPDHPDSFQCMPFSKHRDPGMDGIVCGDEAFIYNSTQMRSDEAYAQEQKSRCCKAAKVDLESNECKALFDIPSLLLPREYPSEYFWNHVVNRVYRPGDPMYGYLGPINWWLFLCSFLTWLIAYAVLYKGLKSLGVMMYIMVPLPYIVLVIMFGVVIPQEGAVFGLQKFFTIDPYNFLDITVWRTATEQAFYSIGVAMGPLITFGSYSKFNSPSNIDCILICLCIFLTSILCSLVVFSVLGFLASKSGRPFQKVVEVGPGLVFIVYPESLELLPGAQFFSALFYIMLLNLGLSTVTGIIETVSSAIYDIWPSTRRYKYLVNGGVLLSCFLIGIPITARGGLTVYNAFDVYAAGIPLIPLCGLELFAVIYIYGIGRYCEDINFMLGMYPNRYYRYQWLLAPFILFAVFVYGLVTLKEDNAKLWAMILGRFLLLVIMGMVVVGMIYQLIVYGKAHKLKEVLKAPPSHGPKKDSDREARKTFSVKRKIF